ncbi:MAG: hypothetical protein J5795_07550, partial [Lachnospiraceae bacterium]|nr:hypothetical protein [Lachnospiraceae bacterium]
MVAVKYVHIHIKKALKKRSTLLPTDRETGPRLQDRFGNGGAEVASELRFRTFGSRGLRVIPLTMSCLIERRKEA